MLPSEITYWLDGTINPAGVVEKSFVLGESVVNIGLNIELPLKGRISNLKAEKEFEFDAATMLDNINFALFQVRVDNGFPLRTELQLYFLDASGQILDILIEGDPTIMEAAPVDGNGIVTNSVEKLMQIELDKDKIDNIQNATTILLEATFSTTDDGNVSVKMLESYEMNIKIGMQTEFQITFDPVNIDPFGI